MLWKIISILMILLLPVIGYANSNSDMLDRQALVDTGYDVCMTASGNNCKAKKPVTETQSALIF
jgi:hypothetical protein